MENSLAIKRLFACLAILFYMPALLGAEVLHRQFAVPPTTETEAINGQIDWMGGPLERWTGPVVAFIPGGRPHDRDGWMVVAMESAWADRLPLKELSAAFVKEGLAVVRFDSPGVRKPELKCRENILQKGVSTDLVRRRCLDSHVLARFTVKRYQRSIEKMLLYIEKIVPATRGKLVLFGFSEGLMHAAAIADHRQVHLRGLAAIGSPAERIESSTRWQTIDRMLELLPAFDANLDGIVSNDEVRSGYKKGIGNVMGMEGWLSPSGYWDRQNEGEFKARLDQAYEMLRHDMDTGLEPGKLAWRRQANGAFVPDMNDALWNFQFYGQVSPADVMQRLGLPGLFMWGDNDTQVSVKRQVKLVEQAVQEGANIGYLRFPGRYHMLSRRQDFDWAEQSLMPELARSVHAFLDQPPATPAQTNVSPANLTDGSCLQHPDGSGGVPGSR